MNFIIILLITAAAATASSAAAVSADNAGARIIGGESTTVNSYPSAVQVDYRNVFLWWYQTCAGVIITPRYVLSVAHCFTGFLFFIDQRRIRAGASVRDSGGITMGITRAYNHPTFNNRNEGDLTVLLLDSNLVFDNTMQAAIIPSQGFELFDYAPVTIAGWGTTAIGGGGSHADELRAVRVLKVNHELCQQYYQQSSSSIAVSDTMICTGVIDGTYKDACDGDEGGPIYLSNDIILGIVSYHTTCADPNHLRVSTKVSAFTDWIQDIITA